MKRISTFYVNLFIWPLIFILFITTTVFILPPTCVERTTMGALLLLSVVILSLMLESYLPNSSANSSVIAKLVGFTMFMVTWSTCVSTFIIALVNMDSFAHRNIPNWIKDVFIIFYKIIFHFYSFQ